MNAYWVYSGLLFSLLNQESQVQLKILNETKVLDKFKSIESIMRINRRRVKSI